MRVKATAKVIIGFISLFLFMISTFISLAMISPVFGDIAYCVAKCSKYGEDPNDKLFQACFHGCWNR